MRLRIMSEEKKFDHLKIEKVEEGNYAVISINRPDRLNALQTKTLKEIAEALEPFELDPNVRCVVLRGTKDYTKKPAFSAGADLSAGMSKDASPKNTVHMCHEMFRKHKWYDLIEEFPKPIIAAVDGFALGGGLELTLVCDIVIATKRSRFGLPEINRGIFPANGGTQRLFRSLGLNRVKKMMFFGDHYSAEQMYEWGFVAYLTDEEEFEDFRRVVEGMTEAEKADVEQLSDEQIRRLAQRCGADTANVSIFTNGYVLAKRKTEAI